MSYSLFEKKIARILELVPGLRQSIRKAYCLFNYLIYAQKGFVCSLHPDVELIPLQFPSLPEVDLAKSSFFGYFNLCPWSADQKYFLAHRQSEVGRIEVVVTDLLEDRFLVIGSSKSWNFQQGCMVQWIPGSSQKEMIFNCVENNRLVSCIVPLMGESRICPWPIQSIHPSGRWGVTLNYLRLAVQGSEYGYNVEVANFVADQPLDSDGIWAVDLQDGSRRLTVSLETLLRIPSRFAMHGNQQVNHLLFSPDGEKIVFLHRWENERGRFSRLLISDSRGENLRVLLDNRVVSHFTWRDNDHLLVWGRSENGMDGYHLIDTRTGRSEPFWPEVFQKYGDGHPSFSPCGRWLVTDSYPDRARQRHLLLFDMKKKTLHELGRFFAPLAFEGAQRCDLHPRWGPDGKWLSIDSAHSGQRGSYRLDISRLVKIDDESGE